MDNFEQALRQAVNLAKQKRYTEARQFLRVIIQHYPNEDRPWYLLAVVAGTQRERVAYLNQCLRLNPANELAIKKLAAINDGRKIPESIKHSSITGNPIEPSQEDNLHTLHSSAPFTLPPETLPVVSAERHQRHQPALWISAAAILGLAMAILVYLQFGQTIVASLFPPSNSVSGSISMVLTGTATAVIDASETVPASQTPEPTATITAYPTATPSMTPTLTATPTETATPFPTHTFTPEIPVSAGIGNIYGSNQLRALSCEASAAVDWARYYGIIIPEMEFQNGLPVSDNPEKGFVGSVDGVWGVTPPRGYGVHAEPVAALLRAYGLSAQAVRHYSYEELQRQIANGHPVIIWFVGQSWTNVSSKIYVAEDGSEVVVAPYEHVVLLVGYGADYVTIMDGSTIYYKGIDTFLKSWGILENMAVVFDESQ